MDQRIVIAGCFVGAIVAANVAISLFGMVPVGFGLLAPAGVYFAGLTFALRDALQETRHGRRWVFGAILTGTIVTALMSGSLALASGVAFLVSELVDFAVYTPLRKRSKPLAVVASNTVGAAVDSALFLSLAFGSLEFLAGQVVGKSWMTVFVVAGIQMYRRYSSWRRI